MGFFLESFVLYNTIEEHLNYHLQAANIFFTLAFAVADGKKASLKIPWVSRLQNQWPMTYPIRQLQSKFTPNTQDEQISWLSLLRSMYVVSFERCQYDDD